MPEVAEAVVDVVFVLMETVEEEVTGTNFSVLIVEGTNTLMKGVGTLLEEIALHPLSHLNLTN